MAAFLLSDLASGVTGEITYVDAGFNNNTDWTLGVNFSVPLTLRESRARVRNTELLITRDRANIQQAIHQTEHALATSLRSLDQSLKQYEAFRDARLASEKNVKAQEERADAQIQTILNQLIAITELANAIVSEAQSLIAYNNELANLEQQSGTILETHGVRFVEERFASIGPHGWCNEEMLCYPKDLNPQDNTPKYKELPQPAEQSFELEEFQRKSNKSADDPAQPVDRMPQRRKYQDEPTEDPDKPRQ